MKSNNHSPTLLMRMQNGVAVAMLENNVSVFYFILFCFFFGQYFINAITYLPYDPIISVLGIYSREMEIHSKKCSETCSVTHIDTIFIIAPELNNCSVFGWMTQQANYGNVHHGIPFSHNV